MTRGEIQIREEYKRVQEMQASEHCDDVQEELAGAEHAFAWILGVVSESPSIVLEEIQAKSDGK